MAATIIPLVAAAISAIGPQIPSIVQMVENLFGHSSQTGQKDGDAKLQTAVTIGQALLQQLANAGKIASAPVVDGSLPAGLTGATQQVVDSLQKQGRLGAAATAASAAAAASSPAAAGNSASAGWTFSGTLMAK